MSAAELFVPCYWEPNPLVQQTELRMGAADTRHNVTLRFSNLVERFTAAAAPKRAQ